MDKFDEMMGLLKLKEASAGSFGQVIAVDRKFELFQRAWCVAEIAEASKSRIPPFLKVASSDSITDNFEKIQNLDVQHCDASRQEDKEYILEKVKKSTTIELFNEELRRIIGGIAFQWMGNQAREIKQLKSEISKLRTRELKNSE